MKAKDAVLFIASKRPTLLMGGMAVILHGFSRTTKDIDIWPDPRPGITDWISTLNALIGLASDLRILRIAPHGQWKAVDADDLPEVAQRDGMVRIQATDRPVDVFFMPNELGMEDFAEAWERATPLDEGLKLMEEVDLIISKQETGRPHDEIDIGFLTGKIESSFKESLTSCSPEQVRRMLDRFATPEIAAYAARNHPEASIRDFALKLLRDMSDQGDPFALELLKDFADSADGSNP